MNDDNEWKKYFYNQMMTGSCHWLIQYYSARSIQAAQTNKLQFTFNSFRFHIMCVCVFTCICMCMAKPAWVDTAVFMLFLTNSSSMLVWHFSRLILLMATRSCRGLQSAAWTTAVAPLPTKHSIHVSNEQSTRRVKDIILDERQTVNKPSGK